MELKAKKNLTSEQIFAIRNAQKKQRHGYMERKEKLLIEGHRFSISTDLCSDMKITNRANHTHQLTAPYLQHNSAPHQSAP